MDQIGICNLALGSVGARTSISSLNESSAAARQCNLQYTPALESVLQAAHWNFARAQVSMAVIKDATLSPPDSVPVPWLYEYAYPADCVQARYIMPSFNSPPANVPGASSVPFYTGPKVPFLITTDLDSNNNRVKVILTNQPQAILVYTTRITDPNLFDGQFVIAFANYFGARMAIPLSGDKAMMRDAFNLADATTKEARASNGNEGLTVIDNMPDWIRVRGYASDWAWPQGTMWFGAPTNLTMIS